uniref:Cytohesin guanine nucleotide exchange n=1 Tax=Echinococcus granulosus TaxID=6210 RepID=A0A068WXP3_ECHGR|nr:cytohesin guanine nucleotide exchange [Echinococcus granulosus]
MLKENVTENRSRMHHRSFSAQTCESVFQPLELSSNPASSNVTLVNNPPIYQHHYQDSRINNPYQTLNGTIRIVERRNRLKQEGHQPRCSSVPVCTSRVQKSEDSGMGDYLTTGMNDSPTSVLRGVAPWMATEEKAVGIKKDSRNRIKHYAHSIRDHLLPLWGQVDFNGKPPPHPLSTHIHPLPEQWSPSETINGVRYSNTSDSKRSRSAQLGVNYLPSTDAIFDEYSFGMSIEDSASVSRKNVVSELPIQPVSTSEFNGNAGTSSPSLGLTSLSPEPLTPSNFPKSKEMVQRVGKTLFNKDPYSGIDYLVKQGILSFEPRIIAEFLTKEGLSRQAIGEYFGKLSDPLALKVTEEFVNHLNLRHVELDIALRRLLEKVHPDGESQKMEFLLEVLKKCYIEQNQEKVEREFHDPETIGVLAYSIMLLHTTFYNRSARKYGKPMTKIEFINNNRGIDNGRDISAKRLEAIYDRIAENEFRTLPDPIDRLRRVDRLFTGPLKPEKLVQRYRRFIAWFSALEVNDFTARKPLISRPTSLIRCFFMFNDLLVITKPLGMNRANAVDDLLASGSHRSRSIDRMINRVGSPAPLTVISPPNTNFVLETPSCQKWGSRANDIQLHCYYSTEVPPNALFLVRQTIPLIDIKVLNFECECKLEEIASYD